MSDNHKITPSLEHLKREHTPVYQYGTRNLIGYLMNGDRIPEGDETVDVYVKIGRSGIMSHRGREAIDLYVET